jgi:polysaccharide deacetylase 2 family uncharacterized protein YibQ
MPMEIPAITKLNKPLVAIVIDDVSNGDNRGLQELLQNRVRVTYAVMPFFPDSKEKAKELSDQGYQVIVHMPMESYDGLKQWLGPKPIRVDLKEKEIIDDLSEAFAQIPNAQGMNNHMGSKVTDDVRIMSSIMGFLNKKQYFFLDSKTGLNKEASVVAKVYNVNYLKRDVFLDENNSIIQIKKQLALAIYLAKRHGYAIAIGHVGITGNNTSRAIIEMLPEFHSNGVELVNLNKIMQYSTH